MTAKGALLLAIAWLAAACSGGLEERIKQLEREKAVAEAKAARFAAESKAKDAYLASVTSLLNDVQDRLEKIQVEKAELVLTAEAGGDGKRFVKSSALPQALDRIAGRLQKNREQLGELELLVARKGQENQGLKTLVERLRRQNGSFERQIAAFKRSVGILSKDVKRLESEVKDLETKVTEKEETVQQQEVVIAEKEEKLQAAESERWAGFFIVGTKRELEAKGV